MITPDLVVAFALRNPVVMDQLGEALRSDLVTGSPFYRRVVEFADDFLAARRKLPMAGDYEAWLATLESGMIRDGTKEALGRLFSISVDEYDPKFFGETVLPQLRQAAALNARARINEMPALAPELLTTLAQRVEAIQSSGLQGLARLRDVSVWARPSREDDLIPTGLPSLDRAIGGWGKELWISFADSGVGKSILLQNIGSSLAVKGKNVLHVTLELGLRPQIHRYYRQIAEVDRSEFNSNPDNLKRRLAQWFRLASGNVYLIEFAANELTPDKLKRLVERVNRMLEEDGKQPLHVVIVDYVDLMSPNKKSRGSSYEDLGFLTHDLRSLCPMFDVSLHTVSQAVRKPGNKARLTMADMGDSYNKVRGADGLMYLVQTPEEEEVFQGRLGLLKTRDSGGRGTEIPLYINRELSVIAELDHPNVVQLMQRLGQLTAEGRPVPPRRPRSGKGVNA